MNEKRCGTCRKWSRGGIGAGRGGGYCLTWGIPKLASNSVTHPVGECWEPKREPIRSSDSKEEDHGKM